MIIADLDMLEDLCDESSVIGGFGSFRGNFAQARGFAGALGENTYTRVSAYTLTTPNLAAARGQSVAASTNDNDEIP